MVTTRQPNAGDGSLGRDILNALRYYLGDRRGLLILAATAVVGGLAFNWSWLVAAGIAPLLLSALPCVAMCALGLCMNKVTGVSCRSDQSPTSTTALDGNRRSPDLAPHEPLANIPAEKPGKAQIDG